MEVTSFEEIYKRAIARFRDYTWLKYSDEDKEYLLRNYLNFALTDFAPICLENLNDFDDEAGVFNFVLSNEVINILAVGVSYYWLDAKIMNSENLRNYMSTKDYTYFSPANLLREMTALKDMAWKEYQRRITMYGYFKADISSLSN